MLSGIRQFFADLRKRPRGGSVGKSLIDRDAVEEMLERSRVPAVLMLVLIWTVSSVLLILSHERQYHLLDWIDGQPAPYSIYATVDFEYDDVDATELRRKEAAKAIPDYYRLDAARVIGGVDAFFSRLAVRVDRPAAAPSAGPAKPKDSGKKPEPAKTVAPAKTSAPAKAAEPAKKAAHPAAVALADRLPLELAMVLNEAYRKHGNIFNYYLATLANRGIVGDGLGDVPLRIVGRKGDFTARTFFSVDWCAGELSKLLMINCTPERQKECREVLKELIGKPGDLFPDPEFTAAERRKAADKVGPVKIRIQKDSSLILKGETFTPKHRKILAAERMAPGAGPNAALRQLGWSFVILLVGVFAVFLLSRDVLRDNLRILLAGLTISLALALNYHTIKIFGYLLQNNNSLDKQLIVSAIPVAFCTVVLSQVLDLRTALCAGGIVAVISAQMIMPVRSLELALRWVTICSGAALAVRHVSNYRSFFVRTVLAVLLLTLAVNFDLLFFGLEKRPIMYPVWTLLGNAVACAMLALLTIFVLELLFNLSTDMALMVLGESNHPLLERMKREAGGTMAHSTAVAVMAEDAARAIGANPLRAKAGALFHDIGKLANPQYFTENNPDSSLLHDKLKPEESSRIILAHVTDGVELARQYRLCRFLRNVISSHHGDDLVRFFYHKAQEESQKTGAPVNEEDFRYHGKLPQYKEEGIICLADACEAASRSIKDPTPEKIAALVGNIFQSRFKDGMLRDCRLTAEELDKLQKSFISSLSCMMRGRIAYPKEATDAKDDKK